MGRLGDRCPYPPSVWRPGTNKQCLLSPADFPFALLDKPNLSFFPMTTAALQSSFVANKQIVLPSKTVSTTSFAALGAIALFLDGTVSFSASPFGPTAFIFALFLAIARLRHRCLRHNPPTYFTVSIIDFAATGAIALPLHSQIHLRWPFSPSCIFSCRQHPFLLFCG